MLKKEGGGVSKTLPCQGQDSETFAGWGFAKNLEESEKSQWPLLMTFCPPFKLVIKAKQNLFRGKTNLYRPSGFKNGP